MGCKQGQEKRGGEKMTELHRNESLGERLRGWKGLGVRVRGSERSQDSISVRYLRLWKRVAARVRFDV